MRKKLIGLTLVLVVLSISVSAIAQILPPISPYYTDTSVIAVGFTIENGVAGCDGIPEQFKQNCYCFRSTSEVD